MYDESTVAVVVPAYNEAAFVGDVLDGIPAFVDRIYAVDDCSTDATWDEIQRRVPDGDDAATAQAPAADGGTPADDRIVPVRHAENQGAGGALRTGYLRAREDGMDVTVAMDADGQMDPDRMTDLLDPVVAGDADYAKGNRLADAEYRAEMPTFRLIGNWLLTGLTRIASGYWRVSDPQNGYTAISHDALSAVDLEAMRSGHDYTNDLLVRLNVAGIRVADVSMPATYGDESSTITYSRFVPDTSATLLRAFLWRLRRIAFTRDGTPTAACYAGGGASAVAGVGLAVAATSRRIAGDTDVDADADGSDDGYARAVGALVCGVAFALVAMAFDARDDPGEVRRE